MAILVTGGTGYIGSHTVVDLINHGFDVVIVDNYCNSKPEVLNRIQKITGVRPRFYKLSVQDEPELRKVFEKENITDVIHFAGLKSVAESVAKPDLYVANNVGSSRVLIKVMKDFGVHNLVFSSSATVYGVPTHVPLSENDKVGGCTNPYGQTKLDIEYLLKDYAKENPSANIAILRYFNPIGAHPSGLIGEDPNGIPNNLMPYIVKVACKELKELSVYGNDYDTIDGTGVRDYIHVVDLAKGHIKAIEKVLKDGGVDTYNLGTGNGYSVLQIINTFKKVNNIDVPYKIVDRRPGDIDACYASTDKAFKMLGWKAELSIDEMCRDSYNFVKKNK
jgi:UDP-glucose 4-epimerase